MQPDDVAGLATGYRMSRILATAIDLGLPAELARGPASAADLAARSGASPAVLARFLRLLASEGIVGRDGEHFSANAVTEELERQAVVIRGWYALDEAYAAFGALTEAVRTGRSPFATVYGQPFYAFHATRPDRAAVYAAAVEAMGGDEDELVQMLRPERFRRLVDVGGEHGSLLWSLLRAQSAATGVLFDLPGTVATARVPDDLGGRVDVVGGNFFDRVPAGGDAYLLATVLRTMDDEDGVRMLKRCREAMAPQTRLLVVEQVLDDGAPPPPGPMRDLVAFVLYGGRERTKAEFADLFGAAGLRLDEIRRGPGIWSCVEAVPSIA